jgi:hypothetical protein
MGIPTGATTFSLSNQTHSKENLVIPRRHLHPVAHADDARAGGHAVDAEARLVEEVLLERDAGPEAVEDLVWDRHVQLRGLWVGVGELRQVEYLLSEHRRGEAYSASRALGDHGDRGTWCVPVARAEYDVPPVVLGERYARALDNDVRPEPARRAVSISRRAQRPATNRRMSKSRVAHSGATSFWPAAARTLAVVSAALSALCSRSG